MLIRNLYLNKIRPYIDKDLIKVITGIRRCGKSVILEQISEELKNQGINDENILLINLDLPQYSSIQTAEDLNNLIFDNIEEVDGKVYLLIDEIQDITRWEKLVNSMFATKDFDIYITGSNSRLLSGELATYLTGRYVEIKVYPFSFKECLHYKYGLTEDELNNLNLKSEFNEYLLYGGMPVTFELEPQQKLLYLSDLFESILLKDIVRRYRIRDIDLLERIMRFIQDNVGQMVSVSNIVNYLKKDNIKVSVNTIYNYLSYFEEACLIYKVYRSNIKGKKILNHAEKYYVVDLGFRQAMLASNMTDISQVIENVVYTELLRRDYKINIGKLNDKEIDFICEKVTGEKIYIQVSYILANDSTIEREFTPLLKIRDAYPKYVLTLDDFDRSRDGIININIIDFLLDDGILS